MATYFVDSINGLNTNDGLTAETAFADFYADIGATATAVDTYWVRNTSSFDLLESKTLSFKHIIFWPQEEDHLYAERPSVSAWDLDDNSGYFDRGSYSFDFRVVANIFSFSNFNITAQVVSTSTPFALTNKGTITFNNCTIAHSGTHSQLGSFVRHELSGLDLLVEFNDCVFNTENGYILSKPNANNNTYSKTFSFNRCSGKAISLIYLYNTTANQQWGNYTLNILECDFVFTSSMLLIGGSSNYSGYSTCYLNMNDSKVIATSIISKIGGVNYCMIKFDVNVDRCDISCSSTVFNINHYGYSTGSQHSITLTFKLTNSVVKGTELVYMYSGANYFYATEFMITGNTLDISQLLLTTSLRSLRRIIYHNNVLLACTGDFIYLAGVTPTQTSLVDIENATIGGHLFCGLPRLHAIVRNCIINGYISDSSVHTEFIQVFDSDFDAIHGKGEYEVTRCRAVQTGGISVAPDCSRAVFRNSEIVSDAQPLSSGIGNTTVIDSIVSTDTSIQTNGVLSIFNSSLNESSVAYECRDNNVLKKLSAVYRLGGSPGSLAVTGPLSEDIVAKVDEVRGLVPSGTVDIGSFFATNRELDPSVDHIKGRLYYVSDLGVHTNIEVTYIEDADSQWDGLALNHFGYKMVANSLDPTLVDYSEKMYLIVYVAMPESSSKEIFFDLKLTGV